MASTTIRWNLVVSAEIDKSLRQHLANSGGGRKGDLSKFVAEAVQERIFEMTVQDIKRQNDSKSEEEVEELIEEALTWARQQPGKPASVRRQSIKAPRAVPHQDKPRLAKR